MAVQIDLGKLKIKVFMTLLQLMKLMTQYNMLMVVLPQLTYV